MEQQNSMYQDLSRRENNLDEREERAEDLNQKLSLKKSVILEDEKNLLNKKSKLSELKCKISNSERCGIQWCQWMFAPPGKRQVERYE